MSAAAPDYAAPLDGWRVWAVGGELPELRLLSIVHETEWPVREELVAQCRRKSQFPRLRRRSRHDAPSDACACGIYAATALDRLAPFLDERSWRGSPYVFGRVLLWGTVIECEHGWRASRAYPAEIFVTSPTRRSACGVAPEQVARSLRAYAVDVAVLPCRPAEALRLVARDRRAIRSGP